MYTSAPARSTSSSGTAEANTGAAAKANVTSGNGADSPPRRRPTGARDAADLGKGGSSSSSDGWVAVACRKYPQSAGFECRDFGPYLVLDPVRLSE